MHTARDNLAVGVVNGVLYAVGGYGLCAPLCVRTSVVEAYIP